MNILILRDDLSQDHNICDHKDSAVIALLWNTGKATTKRPSDTCAADTQVSNGVRTRRTKTGCPVVFRNRFARQKLKNGYTFTPPFTRRFVMRRISSSRRSPLSVRLRRVFQRLVTVANYALHGYLCLAMLSCASNKPQLTLEQIRELETRTVDADYTTVFDASLNAMQDIKFALDVVNPDAGVISARRQTEADSDDPAYDLGLAEESKTPTWVKVVIIATGIIIVLFLVVIVVSALDGDDDDEEKSEEPDYLTPHQPAESVSEPDIPKHHEYFITVNFEVIDSATTIVRTSLVRNQMRGSVLEEAAEIYDPRFFDAFYAAFDNSLQLQRERLQPPPEQPAEQDTLLEPDTVELKP